MVFETCWCWGLLFGSCGFGLSIRDGDGCGYDVEGRRQWSGMIFGRGV